MGNKYPAKINGKLLKEYESWTKMLQRCYSNKYKEKRPTYQNVTCCEEWLLYENFYEWLHSQENFEQWLNGERWEVDKDILVKGNKIYSPDTCCLVPHGVNCLFTKCNKNRSDLLPLGVRRSWRKFKAICQNPFTKKQEYIGLYSTIEEAFRAYKQYKENIIKQVAEVEYNKGNITKRCYEAMMKYEVEITD